jgi:hypothetical protein
MKKLLLILLISTFFYGAEAQTTISPLEKLLTDSICNCLAKVDLSKINSKQDAITAFTDCFASRTDLLMKLADEKHIDPTDNAAMRKIGIDIGKDLLSENCVAFTKISVKMVQEEKDNKESNEGVIEGNFKRIDLKGFNYIVLSDKNNSETSFIWLQQFPGSENFMGNAAKYVGKKLRIKYQEMEVYLPQAKGYYKVKEITGIDFL